MLSIRPNVAEHSLVVLTRSVHPELFQIHRTHHIKRNSYRVRLDITSDGHIITFNSGLVTFCEVIASENQEMPLRRRIRCGRLGETRTFETCSKGLVRYETESSVEIASRELFWEIQQQFGGKTKEHELLQVFGASGRVTLGAVSYMHVDQRATQLTVQAFHTFPDEYAILKSFSTFTIIK